MPPVPYITIPNSLMFIILTIIPLLIDLYLLYVARINIRRLRDGSITPYKRSLYRFNIIVTLLPSIAFGFLFVFFLVKLIESLLGII